MRPDAKVDLGGHMTMIYQMNSILEVSWSSHLYDHSVKMISNQFQGPSPVPRGPSMAKDSEKMFQIEARGQKQ